MYKYCLGLLLTLSIHASANTSLLNAFNNQARFEAEIYHLDYNETSHGHTLDEVFGFVPGVKLTIRKQLSSLILEPVLNFQRGDLTYRGGTNISKFLTMKVDTENFIFDASLLLGYMYEMNEKQHLLPFVKYGYHRWLREVPPVGYLIVAGNPTHIGWNSYTETYQHQFLLLGLEYQRVISQDVVAAVFAGAGSTFNAEMFTNSPNYYTRTTLGHHYHLGCKPIYLVGIKTDYRINETWHLNFNASYLDYAYGKSPAVFYSLEPNSTTQEVTIGLGVAATIV